MYVIEWLLFHKARLMSASASRGEEWAEKLRGWKKRSYVFPRILRHEAPSFCWLLLLLCICVWKTLTTFIFQFHNPCGCVVRELLKLSHQRAKGLPTLCWDQLYILSIPPCASSPQVAFKKWSIAEQLSCWSLPISWLSSDTSGVEIYNLQFWNAVSCLIQMDLYIRLIISFRSQIRL